LDAARPEEEPLEIDAPARGPDRHVELGAWKFVGKIGADRRRLGDNGVAVLERRHLAHRVDREIVRGSVLALAQTQETDVVRFADFFQHPARDRRTRRRGVIKRKLRHAVLHYWQTCVLILNHVCSAKVPRTQEMNEATQLQRSSTRRRTLVLKHPQFAYRQLVDFERLEARPLHCQAAQCKSADRQRPDSHGSERGRAQRKGDDAGGRKGLSSADDLARHRCSPQAGLSLSGARGSRPAGGASRWHVEQTTQLPFPRSFRTTALCRTSFLWQY